jgi:hypothetical protein
MVPSPATQTPASPPQETLEQRFRRLAAEWQQATAHLSSMSAANAHPAYQEIIRLGPDVVPLLLRDMEQNETHWFNALRSITGANPLTTAEAGNIPLMVAAWLRWAKDKGYQW